MFLLFMKFEKKKAAHGQTFMGKGKVTIASNPRARRINNRSHAIVELPCERLVILNDKFLKVITQNMRK